MTVYFDPDDPNNQTCINCAQPWYTWCRLRIFLHLKNKVIHCGTMFGFKRKLNNAAESR